MHHNVFGKKLSRTKNERKRLFSNLARSLILRGRIITSRAKAKAVQPLVEKLVTKAKKGGDANRRLLLKILPHGDIVDMLLKDVKDRFSQRNSGFTRIVKMGTRRSDNAEEVMLSFVDEAVVREPVKYEQKETKSKEMKKREKQKNPTKKAVKKTVRVKKR